MRDFAIRAARTQDVSAIRRLVDLYAQERRLLSKATVTLYEEVPDFVVAARDGLVIGCGAIHVMWEDLAEIRTVAVDPNYRYDGVGSAILEQLVDRARELGVQRLFCLTFETRFFGKHGFVEIAGVPVSSGVFGQMLQSHDEGAAEMLDLERVKPNTLGNRRMLLRLNQADGGMQ